VSFIKTLFLSLMSKTNRLVFKPCIPLYPCLKFACKGKWQGQKRVGVHKLRFFKSQHLFHVKPTPKSWEHCWKSASLLDYLQDWFENQYRRKKVGVKEEKFCDNHRAQVK
jgi:hypothetical protein